MFLTKNFFGGCSASKAYQVSSVLSEERDDTGVMTTLIFKDKDFTENITKDEKIIFTP